MAAGFSRSQCRAAPAGVDSPRFVAGACPTRAGAGYLFLRLASTPGHHPPLFLRYSFLEEKRRRRLGTARLASTSSDEILAPLSLFAHRKTFELEVEVTCEARVRLPAVNKKRRRLLASRGLMSASKGWRSLVDRFSPLEASARSGFFSFLFWRNGRCFWPGVVGTDRKVRWMDRDGWRRNR